VIGHYMMLNAAHSLRTWQYTRHQFWYLVPDMAFPPVFASHNHASHMWVHLSATISRVYYRDRNRTVQNLPVQLPNDKYFLRAKGIAIHCAHSIGRI
jgi:hypothetical protein